MVNTQAYGIYMISIDLAFISANGLGIWSWNLSTIEISSSSKTLAFDDLRNESFTRSIKVWETYLHPHDIELAENNIQNLLNNGKQVDLDYRIYLPSGDLTYMKSLVKITRDEDENIVTIHGANIDVTEHHHSEEKLKLAASVFTNAREAISITDPVGNIIDVNDMFTSITGYERHEVLGKNHRILKSGTHSSEFYTGLWEALLRDNHWSGEIWNRRKNGELYPEMVTISNVRDASGMITHHIALFTDISHIKKQQKELEEMVHLDFLTRLPNRHLFRERLSQAKVECRNSNQSLAVLFIDLDGFKEINDNYGHSVGDQLLITTAKRMKRVLRENDTLARIGGDEFAAVLTGFTDGAHYETTFERLLQIVSETIKIGVLNLKVTASIGVSFYPQDDSDADILIRHADQAMYEAKKTGKNRFHLFDSEHDAVMNTRSTKLKRIRKAMEENEFVLHYQPKVNMKTGEVIGAEALIRWQHPEEGLLPPIKFLPLIENNLLSIELGEWVISSALQQMTLWQQLGLELPVSVNISAFQLQHNGFVKSLYTLLSNNPQISANSLELEVLETSELDNVTQIAKVINDCIKLGVSFALDDFGTGYSSLSYLRHLPTKMIKIDQTFVINMLSDADDLMIIESVIGLAKSFKRKVIAEGVESVHHGRALVALGCELAQGYGIAKPMPAKNIQAWVADWPLSDSARRLSD